MGKLLVANSGYGVMDLNEIDLIEDEIDLIEDENEFYSMLSQLNDGIEIACNVSQGMYDHIHSEFGIR
jgi:hypothetical protein